MGKLTRKQLLYTRERREGKRSSVCLYYYYLFMYISFPISRIDDLDFPFASLQNKKRKLGLKKRGVRGERNV